MSRPGPPGLRLLRAGDAMTGRGIGQVLAHPSGPRLHEAFLRDRMAPDRRVPDEHRGFAQAMIGCGAADAHARAWIARIFDSAPAACGTQPRRHDNGRWLWTAAS